MSGGQYFLRIYVTNEDSNDETNIYSHPNDADGSHGMGRCPEHRLTAAAE